MNPSSTLHPSAGAALSAVLSSTATPEARPSALHGRFVDEAGEQWYCIDGLEHAEPFFMTLAGDSDLWAFVSSAGSLAAGRRDPEGAFLPYETVDKIHARWAHSGPRTWIRIATEDGGPATLWEPFARRLDGQAGARSVWKNLSGTCIRFREQHPTRPLVFEYEWFTAAGLGLVRTARLGLAAGADPETSAQRVSVLDGVLDLLPPMVGVRMSQTLSSLSDAYKWNESAAGGRLGLYTLYAQIWDRAEPKESFQALVAWHAGLPAGARTLLSTPQVAAFCRGEAVESETLTRGRRGAVLAQFEAVIDRPIDQTTHAGAHAYANAGAACTWHQVIDGPCSQVQAFELAQRLDAGGGTPQEIAQARQRNTAGVDELLARADGLQHSADPMAAAHHRANVLFNIMRGGVFVDGTRLDRDDLLAFARQRHQAQGARLAALAAGWPATIERAHVLQQVRASGDGGLERLVLEYLPLTFSRRHGDPSRPWNLFSIRVRDAQGRRLLGYQGNWRDIFQNWEALAPTAPDYLGSMIAVFLGAMTPDGYNPYRIGREGIDWEVVSADDPWAHIGYWGDHQVIYLLRLMESSQAHAPGWLPEVWDRALFSFADVPYRLRPYAAQVADPKHTIDFDSGAHEAAHARANAQGTDGLRVCGADGEPVLSTLGEKLAVLLLAKAGSLVPGGGLWLHTQRPEWNDANNALAGYGLSVVSLAQLRRLLVFIGRLPGADRPFALTTATLHAVQAFTALVATAVPDAGGDLCEAVHDAHARRRFMDRAGALLDTWRTRAYLGADGREPARAPAGLLTTLAATLLPLVDATLQRARRPDGLFDSYNLVDLAGDRAEVSRLYPMLEGQVAMLSSGLLSSAEARDLLDTLFASPLYTPGRRSFLLYPDRRLPGFLERNRLDGEAQALPVVQRLLAEGRTDLLQRQSDGTVRFAPAMASRADLEAAGADLGADELRPLAQAYERVLGHHAFTGRSGTMFGYEGLGCIYWHMVAKLLLAVQECVFDAADRAAPETAALKAHYRRVRDGLGYRKTAAEYGAFPADPYSHTPGEGGAQQPGMTGQVKEEILTRWGELGLRVQDGQLRIDPLLLDESELPADGPLAFTWSGIAFEYRRGAATRLRVRGAEGWRDVADGRFDPTGVQAVELTLAV